MTEKTFEQTQADEKTSLEPLVNELVNITQNMDDISNKKSDEYHELESKILDTLSKLEGKGIGTELLFSHYGRGEFLDGAGNVKTLIELPNKYVIEGLGSSANWRFDTVEILSEHEAPKRIAELAKAERKLFQESGAKTTSQ